MGTFYNENDAYAAQWLRNLVSAGSLPAGHIDARSIADLEPEDLRGYDSCHFFAGIGGWPYALELAGWPADRPVWTGSCPCQPFSSAGKQGGSADERHLWPLWLRLIRLCRPDTILGEQVAGAVGFGWLDRVSRDLEEIGYACGAAVLGAHSVGAPHIRQRLFWVAHAGGVGRDARPGNELRSASGPALADHRGATGGMADAQRPLGRPLDLDRQDGRDGADGGRQETHGEPRARSQVRGLADTEHDDGAAWSARHQQQPKTPISPQHRGSFWADSIWLPCLDGKARRAQPAVHPLAHGIPDRVGQLRAYGNAVVPQTAELFIKTVLQILQAGSLNQPTYRLLPQDGRRPGLQPTGYTVTRNQLVND